MRSDDAVAAPDLGVHVGRHSTPAPEPGFRPRREARRSEQKRPRKGLLVSIVAGVAVIAVVGSVAFLWVGGMFDPKTAAASDGDCSADQRISVVVDPSIARAVEDVAELASDAAAAKGGCLEAEIVAQSSADSASAIAAGDFEGDAWIPGSSVWVDRIASLASSMGTVAPTLDSSGSVAVSPVVLAVPSAHAADVESTPVTWARVRDRGLNTILPDPEASAASLAGLYAVRSVSSAEDPHQFAAAMMTLGKQIPASTEAAISSALGEKTPSAVIMSEAEVAAHNRAKPAELLVAEYPSDGTVMLDYPFVRVSSEGAGGSADAMEADSAERGNTVTAFEKALRAQAEPMLNAGLRRPDGSGRITTSGVSETLPTSDATALLAALKTKELSAAQVEILRIWGIMTLRSRMLAVIDVSGSMGDPTESGLRRIDIFQQAAGGALGQFSGEVELGVWVFSTARAGDQDWEELSPIAPLADGGHTEQVMQVVGSLPSRLGGATGLYDTTLAAVQRVRESYDPEKVNSVLLITDGRNEDDNGIDLDTLLAQLQAQNDPDRPVPVIMVGFGPDTDLDAMQRIAEATGGAAYSASRPEDLGVVLVDALYQRGCRPNCG
jgi:Ca-activated chloride channel family protein